MAPIEVLGAVTYTDSASGGIESDLLTEVLHFVPAGTRRFSSSNQFSTTLHPAAADQRDNLVRPESRPRRKRHFFNPAYQFSTTVKGAGADEFAREGAAIRNRLPSEATSQKNTPGGTLNRALGIPA